jgi:hypothetical protein
MPKRATTPTPEMVARELEDASDMLGLLLGDVDNLKNEGHPWTKEECLGVRERLAKIESLLAHVRSGIALAEWYANPAKEQND